MLAANESDRPVWFDEVKLTVQPGLIVQETHYGPWGLELAGIEGRGSPEHQYKFQGKELIDELDLYLMDFHARYYDAQLGRWHAADPADQFASPYLAMGNNPVLMVDPDGEWIHIAIGAAIGGAFNVITNLQNIKSLKQGLGFAAVGAVAGGMAAATGGATLAVGGGASVFGAVVGSGMAGGMASGGVLGTGNALLGGQSFGNAIQAGVQGAAYGALTGAVTAGVGFGVVKGAQALGALFRKGYATVDLDLLHQMNKGPVNFADDIVEGGLSKAANSTPKLLNQFNSAESLLQGVDKMEPVRGALQGSINGDGNAIFNSITQGGKALPNGRFLMLDGTNIGTHFSKFSGEFTINMKRLGQLYKIRINP